MPSSNSFGGGGTLAEIIFPVRRYFNNFWEYPFLWKDKLGDGYSLEKASLSESDRYAGKGFVYSSKVQQNGYGDGPDVDPEQPITDFCSYYLHEITKLCKERSIELILFTTPMPSVYTKTVKDYQIYESALKDFAQEQGLQFWDFNLYKDTRQLPLGPEDYFNLHHLNGPGAELFTGVFCDVIQRYAAGEDVSVLFYDTVDEKLTYAPDKTMPGAE